METSLHRELKNLYAGPHAQVEVRLGRYRIDAVVDGRLFEIQQSSLAAIRGKIATLLDAHDVTVVKPIVVRRTIYKRAVEGGPVFSRRMSPKRGGLLDLFDELMYFRRVFPHPRLVLETPLVEVEEWRYPGHGRRRRWRRDDHVVEDQKLLRIVETHRLATAADLAQLLPSRLPRPFDTAILAAELGVRRSAAQRIAYCLRHVGTLDVVGKVGNSLRYDFSAETASQVAKPPRRRRA